MGVFTVSIPIFRQGALNSFLIAAARSPISVERGCAKKNLPAQYRKESYFCTSYGFEWFFGPEKSNFSPIVEIVVF